MRSLALLLILMAGLAGAGDVRAQNCAYTESGCVHRFEPVPVSPQAAPPRGREKSSDAKAPKGKQAEQAVAERKAREEEERQARQRKEDEDRRAEEARRAQQRAIEDRIAAEAVKRAEAARLAQQKIDAEIAAIENQSECIAPTDAQIEAVRDGFELSLFDARSARFHSSCVYRKSADDTDVTICGLINSKNSMGAYVGYHPFYAVLGSPILHTIVDGGARSDDTSNYMRRVNLTMHCQHCAPTVRSSEACRAMVESDRYLPLEWARARQQ